MKLKKIVFQTDLRMKPVDDKFFELTGPFNVDFVTDEGTWKLRLKEGWVTDLRSGTDVINYLVPKWGNCEYTATVLLHDCAYTGWMSFELANEMLRQGVILSGEISKFRAWLMYQAVDKFGRGHYYSLDDKLPPPYDKNKSLEYLVLVDK